MLLEIPKLARLVYSDAAGPGDYLREYSRQFDCVEVDQWFWSLYGPDKVVLPDVRVVREYAAAIPDTFRFGIKLPNALTLTHFRQQMVPSQEAFLERLGAFVSQLPAGYTWAVESRNPNHLNDRYFGFLRDHGLAHVFLHGYSTCPPCSRSMSDTLTISSTAW